MPPTFVDNEQSLDSHEPAKPSATVILRRPMQAVACIVALTILAAVMWSLWPKTQDVLQKTGFLILAVVLAFVLLRRLVQSIARRICIDESGIHLFPMWCGESWDWFYISQWYIEDDNSRGRVLKFGISGGGIHWIRESQCQADSFEQAIQCLEHYAVRQKRRFTTCRRERET